MASEQAGLSAPMETTAPKQEQPPITEYLTMAAREKSPEPQNPVTEGTKTVEFNASETYKQLKQKIQGKVEIYRDQLSKLSRNDYMELTQNMINDPNYGLVVQLILEVFKDWASETTIDGDTTKAVRDVAQGIYDSILAMPDSDFFGDMTDTENRHKALYGIGLKDTNKTATLTILVRESLKRANRIKKEVTPDS